MQEQVPDKVFYKTISFKKKDNSVAHLRTFHIQSFGYAMRDTTGGLNFFPSFIDLLDYFKSNSVHRLFNYVMDFSMDPDATPELVDRKLRWSNPGSWMLTSSSQENTLDKIYRTLSYTPRYGIVEHIEIVQSGKKFTEAVAGREFNSFVEIIQAIKGHIAQYGNPIRLLSI